MQVQETLTNVPANLFGSTAAVVIAIVAVIALAIGVEPMSQLLDVRLPVRQLLVGRSLQALTLAARTLLVIAGSYTVSRFAPRTALEPDALGKRHSQRSWGSLGSRRHRNEIQKCVHDRNSFTGKLRLPGTNRNVSKR